METKADMIPALNMVKQFEGSLMEVQEFQKAIKRSDFIYATTFREQIGIICEHIHNNFIKVSYKRIGEVFGENKYAVRNQHDRFLYGKRKTGRPSKLNDKQLELVIQKIYSYHTNPGFALFPGFDDIEEFIYNSFNIQIKRNTLRHIINLKLGHLFKTVIGKPMDAKRVGADINSIDLNLNVLSELIKGVPTNFVINIDEVGNQDFADAEIKSLIAPASYNQLYASYPVSRSSARASCITAISPTGIVCAPQIAVTRSTLDDDIYDYIPMDCAQIIHTDNGYINSASFKFWFDTVFLPALHQLRDQFEYYDKTIIIMDGLKAHEDLVENIDSEKENIIFHFLVPHSSDQTQPLDVGLFGIMKRFEQNYEINKELSQQSNQLIKIINCLFKAATPYNCKAAFKGTGITSYIQTINDKKIEFAHFDLSLCCKVRHYDRAHINELVLNHKPLTINQQILRMKIRPQEQNKKSRSVLKYFPNKK